MNPERSASGPFASWVGVAAGGASIGIAFYPQHAENMDSLIKRADIAMYIAKHGGRNRFHIYVSDDGADDPITSSTF